MGGPGSGRKKGGINKGPNKQGGGGLTSKVKPISNLNKLSKNTRIAKKQMENYYWGKGNHVTRAQARKERRNAISRFGK
jgi:hypothetical protein